MGAAGFTLAEMAIVVLLVGIMLTMGLGMLNAQRDQAAISVTKQREALIQDALVAYLGQNKRLPCPDLDFAAPDGSGDDDRLTAGNTTTRCAAAFGLIPFANLGLTREMALDGWDNFFSYQVSVTPNNWTLTASFNAGSTGGIISNSRDAAGALAQIAGNAVAVIISHGRNGSGAYTVKGTRNALPTAGTDELANTNGNLPATKWKREFTDSAAATGGLFDDVVMVLQPGDLISPLLQRKGAKSFEEEVAQAQQDIEAIKSALIGYAIRLNQLPRADSDNSGKVNCGAAGANDGNPEALCLTGNIPWALLGVPATDPWGSRYKYSVTGALTSTGSKAAFIAFLGAITVNTRNAIETTLTPIPLVPFVVYSYGRNNVAYYVNAAGNNALCTALAPALPSPPLAPDCLGTREVTNWAATAVFEMKPIVIPSPQSGFSPVLGFDDLVDFVPKGTIDAKLP